MKILRDWIFLDLTFDRCF